MALKFLVVDDDPCAREIIRSILTSMDGEVEIAPDGVEAIKILCEDGRAKEFDAVFLDIVMPGADGYQVLEYLKAYRETRDLPVILLSALDPQTELTHSYKKGADYFVSKPFTSDQIMFGLNVVGHVPAGA